jgi:hypothetical protein
MELLHSLNLECQVALKDFSNAIQFLETNKILSQVSQVDTILYIFKTAHWIRILLTGPGFHSLGPGFTHWVRVPLTVYGFYLLELDSGFPR